ncbi:MAG: T9SS type A sorting domain-containing protein [Bacteroidaceae bacterium]
MIKKIASITIVLFLYLLIGENVQAQSLQIQTVSQTKSVDLLSLQKISFIDGNLVILNTNAVAQSYAISTISKLYFANPTTSINSIDAAQSISISPNPCADILTITGAKSGEIVLISIDGKVQLRKSYQAGNSLDLSMLSSGFYLLNINGRILKLRKL